LTIQIVEAAEAPCRQEVRLDIKKWTFDSALSISMADLMSLEPEAERACRYSPERRGELRNPAALIQRVNVL